MSFNTNIISIKHNHFQTCLTKNIFLLWKYVRPYFAYVMWIENNFFIFSYIDHC